MKSYLVSKVAAKIVDRNPAMRDEVNNLLAAHGVAQVAKPESTIKVTLDTGPLLFVAALAPFFFYAVAFGLAALTRAIAG